MVFCPTKASCQGKTPEPPKKNGKEDSEKALKSKGMKMNILFVCSQNKRRSLTAEKILDGKRGHRVRSAGTENNARVKVTPGLLGWADPIFCFEKKHRRRIEEKYQDIISGKKIVTMNVPDDYEYMDEELQEIICSYFDNYCSETEE